MADIEGGIIPAGRVLEVRGSLVVLGTLTILSGGHLVLSDTVWEDLRFPAAGINPTGAASDPTRSTADGRWQFSASATNILAMHVQMPHNWKQGSTIYAHVHWSPSNTDTGNVYWRFEHKVANMNEAFPGSYTAINTLSAGSGTADMHQLHSLGSIVMSGKTISCMILILLSRIGGDGTDTFTGTANLDEFDIHYEIDTLGSREELLK